MIGFIYNDIHKGSPIEMEKEYRELYRDALEVPEMTYSLGDNHDFVNARHGELDKLGADVGLLFARLGKNMIPGNHEAATTDNILIHITNSHGKKIVMAHGDFESWGMDKAIAYRSKPHGVGWIKRLFVKTWNDVYDKFWNTKIKQEFIDRATALMKEHAAQVYICGHKHVDMMVEISGLAENRKIIVLPRGRNEIDFDAL